jgi:hypothetical protein
MRRPIQPLDLCGKGCQVLLPDHKQQAAGGRIVWRGNASKSAAKVLKKMHMRKQSEHFFENSERTGVSPAFRERTFEVNFAMFE